MKRLITDAKESFYFMFAFAGDLLKYLLPRGSTTE